MIKIISAQSAAIWSAFWSPTQHKEEADGAVNVMSSHLQLKENTFPIHSENL